MSHLSSDHVRGGSCTRAFVGVFVKRKSMIDVNGLRRKEGRIRWWRGERDHFDELIDGSNRSTLIEERAEFGWEAFAMQLQ